MLFNIFCQFWTYLFVFVAMPLKNEIIFYEVYFIYCFMIHTFWVLRVRFLTQSLKYFLVCFSFSSRNLIVLALRFGSMGFFKTWNEVNMEDSFFPYEYPIVTSLFLEITNSSN